MPTKEELLAGIIRINDERIDRQSPAKSIHDEAHGTGKETDRDWETD